MRWNRKRKDLRPDWEVFKEFKAPEKTVEEKMTPAQRKMVELLKKEILLHDGNGEQFVDKYEYKSGGKSERMMTAPWYSCSQLSVARLMKERWLRSCAEHTVTSPSVREVAVTS